MTSKPKAISLFSGMGGDSVGITSAGFDVIAFSEFDKAAIESHLLNFPTLHSYVTPRKKSRKIKTIFRRFPTLFLPSTKTKSI